MSKYIVPVFIVSIIILGFYKKVNIYDSFVEGAKESLKRVVSIFPYIATMMIAVEVFSLSGIADKLSELLKPIFNIFGIPSELCHLLVIRPLSGNGSIAMLENIFETYGVDSYISKCASVIVGSNETIFYVVSLYFSSLKTKKLRYTIPVSLITMFIGVVISCFICRFI